MVVMRARTRAAGLVALAAAMFVACNAVLGIEEQSGKPAPDDAAPTTDVASEPDATFAPDRCTTDADCIAPNGCYTGRCDSVLGACTYALCETPGKACSAGRCDPGSSTCGGARDYGFRATTYKIDAALGCKGNAQQCVGAGFPFLFLGTKDGTIALRVDDLLATGPTHVPIAGLGFRAASIVTSARRVWVLGDLQGTSGPPPYQLPIAWIDVPSDPTVRALTATSATLSYPYLSYAAFPAPAGALYLAYDDAAQGFPVAMLAPPLPAMPTLGVVNAPDAGPPPLASVPMYRLPSAPANAAIVASSGARLLLHRLNAQLLNLVAEPGTPKVALAGDVAVSPAIPALLVPRFGQGPDGSVFLDVPIVADPPPPSTDCNCYTHQRHQWVLPNALAAAADVNVVVDPEAYASAQLTGGACHQCSPSYLALPSIGAWIDPKTSLVVAPASDPNRTFAATRVVARDPLAAPPKRRFTTTMTDVPPGNFATDRVALTASAGLGYELVADSEGNELTLSIFDPRCDAQ